jgi:hypothetical protein
LSHIPFLLLVIFNFAFIFLPSACLDCNSPIYTSHIAGMTGAHYHLSYWLRWGLNNFLPEMALNYNSPNFCH